jgi:hypothetical protein
MGEDPKEAGFFAPAVAVGATAALISCILLGAIASIAMVGSLAGRAPSDPGGYLLVASIGAMFAVVIGFISSFLFLAPAIAIVWKLRRDRVGTALAGAGAGAAHTLCGGALFLTGHFHSKTLAQDGLPTGFALPIIVAELHSWPAFLGLLATVAAVGALAGGAAGGLDRGRRTIRSQAR